MTLLQAMFVVGGMARGGVRTMPVELPACMHL